MSPTVESVPVDAVSIRHESTVTRNYSLNVAVVFTSIATTLAALRKAGARAGRAQTGITLIVPQTVPYPLSLNDPPVSPDFTARHFRVLAEESPVETTVRIYLCRDRLETLLKVLDPHSLVVIGGCRRWWPTADARLARQLQRSGYRVVFVEA